MPNATRAVYSIVQGTGSSRATARVLVADDYPLTRAGVTAFLQRQPDLEVVGEARDARETLRLAAELTPHVVVLDLHMPGADGFETVSRLRNLPLRPRVVAFTGDAQVAVAARVMAAGASGYVVKRASSVELLRAVRAALGGREYVDESLDLAELGQGRVSGTMPKLSEREHQVLRLAARGYTQKEIAERLGVGVKSIETYRARLAQKLGLHRRADLVRYAIEAGLLDAASDYPHG